MTIWNNPAVNIQAKQNSR